MCVYNFETKNKEKLKIYLKKKNKSVIMFWVNKLKSVIDDIYVGNQNVFNKWLLVHKNIFNSNKIST